jgi:hypothetical protein
LYAEAYKRVLITIVVKIQKDYRLQQEIIRHAVYLAVITTHLLMTTGGLAIMAGRNNPRDTDNSVSDDFVPTLIAGAVFFLAGYGLYKILKSDSNQRHSIGGRREQDILSILAEDDIP